MFEINQRVQVTDGHSKSRTKMVTPPPPVGTFVTVETRLFDTGGDPAYRVRTDSGGLSVVFESELRSTQPYIVTVAWYNQHGEAMSEVFGPFDDDQRATGWVDDNEAWFDQWSDTPSHFAITGLSRPIDLAERDALIDSTAELASVHPIRPVNR